jgi:hypothetical protein
MITSEYYRTEAERCRELATRSSDETIRRRWLLLAMDYDQLAFNLDRGGEARLALDDRRAS